MRRMHIDGRGTRNEVSGSMMESLQCGRFAAVITMLVVAVISTPVNTRAGNMIPRFQDYPAVKIFTGNNAPLILSGESRKFRTRLRAAANQRPNFAGHYILTTWGCGMKCLMGAVIDSKTGKVHQIPFTLCCWGDDADEHFEPIEFRLDSRLIIFNGVRNEKDGDEGRHFYLLENNRFKQLTCKEQ